MERQLKDYEIQCLDSRFFLVSILQKLTRENQLAITEDGYNEGYDRGYMDAEIKESL